MERGLTAWLMTNRVRVVKCVALGHWSWKVDGVGDEVLCGICQSPYDGCCPICRVPGDACPLMWGACRHSFHMHCIVKWLEQQSAVNASSEERPRCPMCRQEWREMS